jgi:predicted DNA-binding transcriptional regulator AlpA
MPAANTEGEILTIKEVAVYLKVTERTIYRLAGAKKIPAFKALNQRSCHQVQLTKKRLEFEAGLRR